MPKYNKQLLIDSEAQRVLREARDILTKDSCKKATFSSTIKELIGKYVRFISLPDDVRRYIAAFVDDVSKEEGVLGLLLFGSVARGTYNKNSDIDLFIVVRDNKIKYYDIENEAKMRIEKLREPFLQRGYHLRISTTILDVEDLKSFQPIYISLLLDGITLYEKNFTLTDFFNTIRKTEYRRSFTERGEELRWK